MKLKGEMDSFPAKRNARVRTQHSFKRIQPEFGSPFPPVGRAGGAWPPSLYVSAVGPEEN